MPKTKSITEVPKSKRIIKAEHTIERELTRKLGEKSKTILEKIDTMAKKKKSRRAIEKMMVDEIAEYTRHNLQKFIVFLT